MSISKELFDIMLYEAVCEERDALRVRLEKAKAALVEINEYMPKAHELDVDETLQEMAANALAVLAEDEKKEEK